VNKWTESDESLLDVGPLYTAVGGFVMPVRARTILADEARDAIVAEAMAWHYSQEEPALRSASLADFAPDTHGVMGLVVRRAALLRALGHYPTARLEMRGRLLCCQLGRSRPRVVVPELFDPNGLPAWDLWCWSREDYLVAWIPRSFEHHVAVQAELSRGRYRWLLFPFPEPERF
jgi:hypothetical protein